MTDRKDPGLPGRKCNCSGSCGPQPTNLSRRQFLHLVGVGGTAALVAPAFASFELPTDKLEQWRRSLFASAAPRRYVSGTHSDARLHLGGIGTGNFEIGCDGQLTTWQLFNTLRDGHVPFYFLARVGDTTRLLQTAGGPDWPRIKQIEMAGEYPVASLHFGDPELPVSLKLDAFTPFAPLDAELSSLPLAAFIFRAENPGPTAQTVSIAALMQNPVGYEATGDNRENANPCFGGNINEVLHRDGVAGVLMRAVGAGDPTLDVPVAIYTLGNLKGLKSPPNDRPVNLNLEVLDKATLPAEHPSARTLVWLEDAPVSLAPSFLSEVQAVVKAGATLLLAGKNQPLLKSYASWTGGKPLSDAAVRPDILFEDFENGYDKWQVEGSAFGKAPARGTLPNQQAVSGFLGEALVNTYLDGDDTTGRLTSATFQIERRFIRFLIGGGHHAQTQIRLIVDGKVAHAASGKDNEKLESAFWDVSAFAGQSAHLEIVDNQKGPWGHINLDQIVFTDLPGPRELMVLLEQLLPVRFSGLHQAPGENSNSVELRDVVPQSGSNQTTLSDGRSCWVRQVGQGKVVLASGQVLDPKQSSVSQPRRRAYEVVCALAGAKYRAGQGINPKAPGYGSLALVTTASNASVLPEFTDWNHAWKLFSPRGEFDTVKDGHATGPTAPGQTTSGAVCATFKVPARGSVEVPFVLAWCYPNKYNAHGQWMGCRYASQWPDVSALVRTARKQLPAWRSKTELFRKTMYETSLPYWITDCLTANAAIMRHIGVVFRIANGDVYGWEGSNGCCDPTCTHVWGYEQTLSRLFPDLEREMRRIDFKHQQRPDGGINNRTEVPSPAHPSGEQPFADGHASCILKAYREALNHTDDKFFQEYWPFVKRGVEYLIDRDARAGGGSPTGVLQDDQWNTYDEALHGVTTFISGYYLAALRAGEEWARRVGDSSAAGRFQEVFHQGQAKLVELCWNGEYFQQHLADYAQRRGEVGPGCMSDQLIGQWWAHQLGLGYILPREKVISSLRAIYRYNFKTDLTHWKHSPRAFAGAGDKGLIICTWPRGGRPEEVMLYSDEVWTGIEYQAAAHFVYEGLLEEGLAVAKAARERYDGIPRAPIERNPWNEIECGGHYARAMSSWSLLLALSGWQYDGPRGELAFIPRHSPERFKSFFCGPEGWGTATQVRDRQSQTNELLVRDGKLKIKKLSFQMPGPVSKVQVRCGGRSERHTLQVNDGMAHLALHETAMLDQAHSLSVRFDFPNR